MAVMLTQWSPVPWSGETVPRPAPPSPSEGAAPTPIYESLVHEWSRAGRAVPGRPGTGRRAPGGEEPTEPDAGPGPWRRVDDVPRPPFGAPPPAPEALPEALPEARPEPRPEVAPEAVQVSERPAGTVPRKPAWERVGPL